VGSGLRAIAGLRRADESLNVTWIGHSTVLIEAEGVRVLTDPLLRRRVAHLWRVEPLATHGAASVDAILVSHVHHDHLDFPSLRMIEAKRVVVPQGAGRLLRRRGFEAVVELGAGDEASIGTLTVRATHAEHRTRRHPFAPTTPALGYVVANRVSVYFAGDTDVFDGMRDVQPELDLALLPIAGWGSRLPQGHLDPRAAADALRLLRPRMAVPIHWGTYRRLGLSRDAALLREAAESFERFAAELAPEVAVTILSAGESIEIAAASASAGR
jgi:L-ascorbate metabolism protein UlaG (beta-lactamase superfamily)